jgi:O-6-methylguanine DNA methyltransferase
MHIMNSIETTPTQTTLAPDTIVVGEATTPLGPFGAVFTPRGLACLTFPADSREGVETWVRVRAPKSRVIHDQSALADLSTQLTAYFEGALQRFSLPLDLRGTPFQLDVWRALQEIPYGEVRSYGDIARAIGRPRAVRAVGMANHDNPIPIIVPCHRVIGSNRTLTGYGGGLELKERLLELEGVLLGMKSA